MKRTPLKRKTPLRAKRPTPRRDEGRVAHQRTKRKATSKTAEEARFLELVASLGCLICGKPASVHHIMHAPGKQRRRDHRFVAPLCREHHQGDSGVHGLGSESAFLALWGVDLVGWAMTAWTYRDAPDAPFWRHSVTRWREIARPTLLAYEKGGPGARKDEQTRIDRP